MRAQVIEQKRQRAPKERNPQQQFRPHMLPQPPCHYQVCTEAERGRHRHPIPRGTSRKPHTIRLKNEERTSRRNPQPQPERNRRSSTPDQPRQESNKQRRIICKESGDRSGRLQDSAVEQSDVRSKKRTAQQRQQNSRPSHGDKLSPESQKEKAKRDQRKQ